MAKTEIFTPGDVSKVDECRLCKGSFYKEKLTLRKSPLANELYPNQETALTAEKFPLELVMCEKCAHVQLHHVVKSERLFASYVYKTGTSQTFRRHFAEQAKYLRSMVSENSTVVDVGSNDGILLEQLEAQGVNAVGIEPSKILTDYCAERGLKVVNNYLNQATVDKVRSKHSNIEAVVANNVFAHIPDMIGALNLINELLPDEGYFVFEVAYFSKLVENFLFDTIYHEHMSYHSLYSLEKFLISNNFNLIDVEEISTHGGSIRVTASKNLSLTPSRRVRELIEKEIKDGITSVTIFEKLHHGIRNLEVKVQDFLWNVEATDLVIGFGAPAKAVTFMSEMGIAPGKIAFIIDDNLDKQNKFLPGTGIVVKSSAFLTKSVFKGKIKCIIFPWNLSAEIRSKLEALLPSHSEVVNFLPSFKVEVIK